MLLPATLRLAPHTAVLAPGPTARLLGADPDRGLLVEDLPPPLAGALDGLHAPVRTADVVVSAAERGVPPSVTTALLAALVEAGALVDAELEARAARARSGGTVVVHGCGALAAGVVVGLLRAGVGTVHLATGGVVDVSDLGTGLVADDLGRARLGAIGGAVRRLVPGSATRAPPRRLVPDLAVLADEPPTQDVLDAAHRDRTPHLIVALSDGQGVVGPLVVPGRTPCLGCLERNRTEDNPYRPGLRSVLAGGPGRADPACAVATVGLAVTQALAALDGLAGGQAPPVLSAALELDVMAGTLLRRPLAAHPACGCAGRTSAKAQKGGTIVG